ncbi:TPR_REGION domain-containing protein [Pseudozyma hubeiensis]|nr:TPR_REGION domain-containing protein [Pseudozyma hubeiensis]
MSYQTSALSATQTATDAATKFSTGLSHKLSGNTAFTSGDITGALSHYHYAILYFSGLDHRSVLGLVGENSGQHGKPEDLSTDEEDADQKPDVFAKSQKELSLVYSNMSACYLKQQKWDRAVESADKALRSDSGNVKARFRKGKALRGRGDVYAAQKWGKECVDKLKGKEEVAEFERELKEVEGVIEEKEKSDRGKWKGFLGKNPKVLAAGSDQEAGQADASVGKGKQKALDETTAEESDP